MVTGVPPFLVIPITFMAGGVSRFVLLGDGPPRLHPPSHLAGAVLRSGAGIRPRRAEDYCLSGPPPPRKVFA